MNPLLISDIFLSICDNLELNQIINLELLSTNHKLMIRNNSWFKYFYIKNNIILNYVLNNYKLKKLIISSKCDGNLHILKLKNCHTLDLSCTKITDSSVKELKKCHTLNLRKTKITDSCVKELKNCHTLDLYGTKISNECIEELKSHGCIVHK